MQSLVLLGCAAEEPIQDTQTDMYIENSSIVYKAY